MVQEWHLIVSLSLKTFVHGQENRWHPYDFYLGLADECNNFPK